MITFLCSSNRLAEKFFGKDVVSLIVLKKSQQSIVKLVAVVQPCVSGHYCNSMVVVTY